MGLNGGNQSVTIDLPGPLHSGSSVTTDEHLYIRIDIPSPTIEEQDYANLPLGEVHTTLAVAMPKTPWKPRTILLAEVGNLITQGMTEDYDSEPEHSAMAKELATEAEHIPTTEDRDASPATGHFLSSKCSRDRGLHGKQSQCLQFSHSSGI